MASLFQLPKASPVSAGSSYASARAHFYQAGTTTNITPGYNFPATYNDSNVVARVAYWYRLRAQDDAGISDYSQPMRVVAEPPSPPWQTYGYSFANEARLQWYYPQRADGFKIERAPDFNGTPGNWSLLDTRPPTPTAARVRARSTRA